VLFDERQIEEKHRALMEAPEGLQLLGAIGCCVDVFRNNALSLSDVAIEELVASTLGIRISNSLGASVKLVCAGYFAASSSQLRDISETAQLLEFFALEPRSIKTWVGLDGKTRYSQFGFSKIKNTLLKEYGTVTDWPERFYFHSEYGTHPSAAGGKAIHSAGSWQTSPHYDAQKLQGLMLDIANDACKATRSYIVCMDRVSKRSIKEKFPREFELWQIATETADQLYSRFSDVPGHPK
jgi:hypothetical protein